MKQELYFNINWTAYSKKLEQDIQNNRLRISGGGQDAGLLRANIKELTEELDNIYNGNFQTITDKYEQTLGKDEALNHFYDFLIEKPVRQTEVDSKQSDELFLDALTDMAVYVGWQQLEFDDSRVRTALIRDWATEFADLHQTTDWESADYITTVDQFVGDKLTAYINEHQQMLKGRNTKDRITDINVYSGRDNRMYIRCKIDGEQQISRKLSFADVCKFNDRTDRMELAARYFKDVLEPEQSRQQGMKR